MLPFARSPVKEWWCEPLELRCAGLLERASDTGFWTDVRPDILRDRFVFRVSVERRVDLYSSYHRYYLMPDKGQKMDLEMTIV